MPDQPSIDLPTIPIPDGPWPYGIDSVSDMLSVPTGFNRWGTNTLNKGGNHQTRPGLAAIFDPTNSLEGRGLAMFYPKNAAPNLVKACGSTIRVSPYPFTKWTALDIVSLGSDSGPVYLTSCIMGAETQFDGTLKILPDSFPILMIQDGLSRAWSWDGTTQKTYNPDPNNLETGRGTIIGKFGTWAGSRYWVAQGNKLYAMNILEPTKATEQLGVADGGYFTLPGEITGIAKTSDEKSLLVFTATTTSAFKVTLPRNLWGDGTQGFQQEILPNIGCIAHFSIHSQYGMLWWYSQGGWINLDEALTSFRSSRIRYKDENMNFGKSNLSSDRSRICSGSFENFLFLSVPSGHIDNVQTWLMDEMPDPSDESSLNPAWASVWSGIAPVQWVTAEVYGRTRVFALSKDATNDIGSASWNVWEAFTGARQDLSFFTMTVTAVSQSGNTSQFFVTYPTGIDYTTLIGRRVNVSGTASGTNDGIFTISFVGATWFKATHIGGATNASETGTATIDLPVDIPCSLELRYLKADNTFKTFLFALALVSELKGTTHHTWFFASRHSAYLQILDTTTIATTSNIDPRDTNIGNDALALIRQTRELRSNKFIDQEELSDAGEHAVEHTYDSAKDRGFSLLFNWVGQASYDSAVLFVRPKGDKQTGPADAESMDPETTERTVDIGGSAVVSPTTVPVAYTAIGETRITRSVRSVSSRVIETEHNLLVI